MVLLPTATQGWVGASIPLDCPPVGRSLASPCSSLTGCAVGVSGVSHFCVVARSSCHMRRFTAWRLRRFCLVRRTDLANRRRPLAFFVVSMTRAVLCAGPQSPFLQPSSAYVHDGASRPGPYSSAVSWPPLQFPYLHISIFVFFLLLSAFLLLLHLWSVGHDAPDLPPAPAAVLAGHERAQLVSRVTTTGH